MKTIKKNSIELNMNGKDQQFSSNQNNPQISERNDGNYTTVLIRVECAPEHEELINLLLSQVRIVVSGKSQSDIEMEQFSANIRAQY
jgi:hypothetical protein